MIDYRIWFDDATGTFEELVSGLTITSYTATSLTQGLTYQFKVEARNAIGYSDPSNTISVLTAQQPATPVAPMTTWSPDDVVVSWTAPDDGGSPITGYIVSLRQNDDLTFTVEATNCDISSSTSTTCTIPVSVLRTTPYSLEWGSDVYANLVARNIYGDSSASVEGNGAMITTSPDVPINFAEVYAQRTKSTLGLTWDSPIFTGGDVIIDYRVNIAQQGGSYSVLTSGVTDTSYTAIGLTAGTTYEFKIEARNSYGFSTYSSTITLLCAFIPEPPLTVTTTNTNELVTVQWVEPVSNGSPITAYRIYVQETSSTTFTEETVECVGTDSSVIASRTCTITLLTLQSSPYSLVQGDSVYVKIISVNVYGESVQSAAGNGAVIQIVPDAPISLANDPTTTTDLVIKFTWSEGANNGGTAVIDYDVYYDQGTGSYVLLESGVSTTYYLTTVTLTPGTTYAFKVQARNSVDFSVNSAELSVLAAKLPDVPLNLVNVPVVTTGYQVGLSWTDGVYDGASPVIDYQVSFKEASSSTYTIFASGILTQSETVTGLTPGVTYDFVV